MTKKGFGVHRGKNIFYRETQGGQNAKITKDIGRKIYTGEERVV